MKINKKIWDFEILNLYISNIYFFILVEISEFELINEKWRVLFIENENFNIILSFFYEILLKYLKMFLN